MKLAHVLDDEFKRVAKEEDLTMEDLVAEVACLVECSARMLYNYRSGKWLLPGDYIPILCKRFRSLALRHALDDACRDTQIAVPSRFDLGRMVSQTVREDLKYYEAFLDDFESDGIDASELARLRELAERVIGNAYRFVEIAAQDCEQRTAKRSVETR